jgi:hypothetical protein
MKKCILLYWITAILGMVSCNMDSNSEDQTSSSRKSQAYSTWENMCFDRAASIWLIKNFVDPEAKFRFQKFGTKITEGIPFDVPGAELGRQKNICCFESIIQKYKLTDPAFLKMSEVIHDIDVNKWGMKLTKDADSLGNLFTELRKKSTGDEDLLLKTQPLFGNMYKNYSR